MARDKTSKKVKVTPDEAGQQASPQQVDAETGDNLEPIELWLREIEDGKVRFEDWWKLSKEIVQRYRDDRVTDGANTKSRDERRYNVLWSAMETMKPLVYNRPPTPFTNRRHKDSDPVGRDASMLIERGLSYSIDTDELHLALEEARDDYLLSSRGVVWFKYTPYFKLRESETDTYVDDVDDKDEIKDYRKRGKVKKDDEGREYYNREYEEKIFEECNVEHVAYDDFMHGVAAKWSFVPWVARRVPMTRRELVKRFGKEMGARPPLTLKTKTESNAKSRDVADGDKSMFGKAEVWEIWNKVSRKVMWLCPALKETFLDVKDDILGLDNFFPCPRPVYGTKTNDSLIPVPDFKIWQDVAMELDDVTYRISLLTKAIRLVGVYDASAGDKIRRIVTHTKDNDLIPVDNWALFAERGGIRGAVEWVDISIVMAALDKLISVRQQLLQELYEITGLSDIVRGATDPRETALAQSTKAGFANKRLTDRQNKVARMARDGMEIMAEIICKHYSKDYIRRITDADELLVNPTTGLFDMLRFETALDLMRNAPMSRFRIKIDEKNLAMVDEATERQDKTQFLQATSQFLTAALPMVMQYPATAPLVGELLMFGVRSFNSSRSTEASIEQAIAKLLAQPPPQQPQQQGQGGKSSAEIQVMQQKNQIAMGHLQLAEQKHSDTMQQSDAENQLKANELQVQASRGQSQTQIDQARLQLEAATRDKELEMQGRELSSSAQMEQAKLEQQLTRDHHELALAFMRPKPAPGAKPSNPTVQGR